MFVFFKVSSCTIAWLCRKMLLLFCRFTPNIFIQRLRLNTRCRQQKNLPNAFAPLPAFIPTLSPKRMGAALNGISKATDPSSGGRHMSNHFAKPEWHIENISSATGTHDLHAVGVARAMVYYDHKGIAITSHGESATSEGYVYEAINGASNEQLPVIFVLQDNGYGISVPKKDQTANRKVADNFSGFKNLRIIHCNGKDVFDSMNAMTEAREHAINTHNPVIVHANCVRIGSHSNSDKQTLYRDENELAYVKAADPLQKFRRMLLRYNRLTEEELKQIEAQAKKDLSTANRKAMAAP